MLLVAATAFMEILDGTILSNAAPAIARSFSVASSDISLTITSYLITLAVLIPISGWLCERWGTRTVYVSAIAVFTAASAACAASSNLTELVALRVVQGAGAAMMVPVGRLVVLRGTARGAIVRAVAFLTWPALAAPIIAPLLSGWIVSAASWRWIFVVNVPLGLLAVLTALRLVPQIRSARRPPLDWTGFALCTLSSSAVVVAADALGHAHVDVVVVAVALAVTLTSGYRAVRHLLAVRRPLLDLRLLEIPTFRAAHTGGSLLRMTINAVPFLLPLLFQDGLRWTPVKAGALVLWLFVGNLAIKPTTTGLLRRFGFRRVLTGSCLCLAATMFAIAVLGRTTPLVVIVVVLVVSGAARSVGLTALNTVTFADVDEHQMTSANTLSATVSQLALGLGVALGALALRLGALTGSDVPAGGATPAFRVAFLILAVLTIAAAADALRLDRRAGQALLNR